jgi:hypothetical protein
MMGAYCARLQRDCGSDQGRCGSSPQVSNGGHPLEATRAFGNLVVEALLNIEGVLDLVTKRMLEIQARPQNYSGS